MLPRSHRLTNDRDFRRVYIKGAHFFSKYAVIRKAENGLPSSRFGIVVSQKIAKKATDRNLIKRRISEIIRLKLAKIKNGYDCAIIVKKTIIKASFSEINQDIAFILKRSALL